MASSRRSSTSNSLSDATSYDDVPSDFFTFSTPLSFDGSGIVRHSESTDSIPDLIPQGAYSGGARGPVSPKWIPLTINPAEAPLACDIAIPKPLYDSSIDDESDTSFADSLKGSFVQRRRPAEYVYRPPVWRIRPLKDDNGFSSSGSDSDTNLTSELGITDHLNICQFCSTERLNKWPAKKSMPDFCKWFNSQASPGLSRVFLDGYEGQQNAMDSTWVDEPLFVAMASIPDFDMNWLREDKDSASQSKDKEKAKDEPSTPDFDPNWLGGDKDTTSSSNNKGKTRDESLYQSDSGTLKRSLPSTGLSSEGKGKAKDKSQRPPLTIPLKRSLQSKGKGKDESQYGPSSNSPKSPSQENTLGSKSGFYIDSDSDHGEHRGEDQGKKPPPWRPLTDPNCPSPSNCLELACQTAVPGANIPGAGQADSKADLSDAEFVSAHSEPGRADEPERCQSGKRSRSTEVAHQPTTVGRQGSITAGPSTQTERTITQQWKPLKQNGVCVEKILDTYKDIRAAPSKDGETYGIKSGSRVVCIGDTNVSSTAPDEFRLKLGDAFIILQMYGDLWASCLKLSLTDPVTSVIVEGSPWLTKKREYVWPSKPEKIKFLPLCSVTLEENFGQYIRRRPKFSLESTKSLPANPYNGQSVVPPDRHQSRQSAKVARGDGSVLIPRWMVKECTKIHRMPKDAPLTIPRNDREISRYGHVNEPVTHNTMSGKGVSGTDEPEETRAQRIASLAQQKLTAKNGRILGVGKMRRTQSSQECDSVREKPNSGGYGDIVDRYLDAARKEAEESGRTLNEVVSDDDKGKLTAMISAAGAHSPHRNMASNPPNPLNSLAGPSTQTEVRDFAPNSAISTQNATSGGGAPTTTGPSSADPGESSSSSSSSNDDGDGDGVPDGVDDNDIPKSGAPEGSNSRRVAPSVVASSEAHKEAFSAADQVSSGIGSQPYVSVGEVPAPEETTTETAASPSTPGSRKGAQATSLPSRKWSRLSQIWRMKRGNRHTISDLGP